MGFTEAEARRMIEAKRDDDMVSAAAAAAAAVAVAKGEEEFDPFELPASAKIVELNEQPLLAQAKTEKIRFSDDHVITTEWIPFVDNGVSKGFWGWCIKRVPRGELKSVSPSIYKAADTIISYDTTIEFYVKEREKIDEDDEYFNKQLNELTLFDPRNKGHSSPSSSSFPY